jgi:hypothetical protein
LKGRIILKKIYSLLMIQFAAVLLITTVGCEKGAKTPQEALDRYFTSAIKQDYATTYTCYSSSYKKKVSKDEYIKHRKDASVLLNYKVLSLNQEDSTAQAEVLLTFGPSEKLKRTQPVDTTVKEDLIKEKGNWKIKVL